MRGSSRPSRWITTVLVLSLTSVVGAAPHHERKRMQRAEIGKLEEQWRQAELAEDVPQMDHMLSDDFLGITAAGQVVTKVQELDRIHTHHFDLTRLDMTDRKIKITGSVAVVTSLAHLEGTVDGRPLSGSFRYTRVYQRTPGDGWKITNFEATRVPGGSGAYGMNVTAPGAGAPGSPAAAPSSAPATPVIPGSPRPQS